MKIFRITGLAGLALICALGTALADTRSGAPSRQDTAAMSRDDLQTLFTHYRDVVESDRQQFLAATTHEDLRRLKAMIRPHKTQISTIRAGLNDRIGDAQKNGNPDEAAPLIQMRTDFQTLEQCLSDFNNLANLIQKDKDAKAIEAVFGGRYGNGQTLGNFIEGDTSGDYEKLLLLCCGL